MIGNKPAAMGHPMPAPSVTGADPSRQPRQRYWEGAGGRCTYSPAESRAKSPMLSLNEGPQAWWGTQVKVTWAIKVF